MLSSLTQKQLDTYFKLKQMGRHYHGDIEGKFMFAVQSSYAADRFGVKHRQPDTVEYYFDKTNLEKLRTELTSIKETYDRVSKFFEKQDTYTQKDVQDSGISQEDLKDYADYKIGKQIYDCVLEDGCCSFTAEL